MTRPRLVVPGQFYLVTRRCTQRQFLLRPDDETNSAFIYCLAEAAHRFEIDILLVSAMSNHYHASIYDRHGHYPAFIEHFHKMLARCMNARWGRWENFWSSEEACVTRLLDRDTILDKLVYAAVNPVKDMLVDQATQWPGVNGYCALVHRKQLRARRPRHFFKDGGVMPEEVTLELVISPELGPADEVIDELKQRVESFEQSMRDERAKTGARVFGTRRIKQQSWRESPTTIEPRRNLRPRFAGRTEVRVQALLEYKAFLASYAFARKCWLGGLSAPFPRGTYWLARFAPVQVTPLPS